MWFGFAVTNLALWDFSYDSQTHTQYIQQCREDKCCCWLVSWLVVFGMKRQEAQKVCWLNQNIGIELLGQHMCVSFCWLWAQEWKKMTKTRVLFLFVAYIERRTNFNCWLAFLLAMGNTTNRSKKHNICWMCGVHGWMKCYDGDGNDDHDEKMRVWYGVVGIALALTLATSTITNNNIIMTIIIIGIITIMITFMIIVTTRMTIIMNFILAFAVFLQCCCCRCCCCCCLKPLLLSHFL